MSDQWIPMSEAAVLLGVSRVKMSELVREGVLAYERGKLDKRVKLVRRADVEKLAREPRVKGKRRAS